MNFASAPNASVGSSVAHRRDAAKEAPRRTHLVMGDKPTSKYRGIVQQ